MKKLAFYMSLIVTGLLMAACSKDDFKDWAIQKTYLPEDAITIPGYTASAASAAGIDLNAETGETVQLVNLSGAALPEGYLLTGVRAYLVPADNTTAEPVILEAANAEGYFNVTDLQEAVVKFYGPRPTPRTFVAHVYADAIKDGQSALIDAGEINIILTPVAPQIAENYYLVGGPNDWEQSAVNKTLKFNHSGKDVYEDPVFTVVFPASAGDTWFAIGDDEACEAIANNSDWSKLFGTTKGNGNTDPEGTLDRRFNLTDDGSFCVPSGAKFIKVTLNMMDRTYKIEAVNISENYYLVGGPNDWEQSAVNKMLKFNHSSLSVVDDPVFSVVFPASEGDTWFAFGDDEACEAIAGGTWNKLFGTKGESTDLKGSFDYRYNLGDDHSFCVPAGSGKFIKLQINMMTFEYEITPLNYQEFIYVPGNGQKYNTGAEGMPDWGWTPGLAAALQSPNFDGVYTGYVYLDGGFKFTKERDWDHGEYNWTDFNNVPACINNGAGTDTNLYCDTPGLYFLKVDVATGKIEATKITNMNLVGDFNGWNPGDDAQKMTWDAANVCFTITGAGVNANGWKFTANNDWVINLGSNDSAEPSTVINDLVGNGKNIGVVGTTIKLYPCRTNSDKIYCTVE